MKYRVVGNRIVEDLKKSQRVRLATSEFVRVTVAQWEEETQTERELRLFLAGEISFAQCQHVPAKYRVYENPKFYAGPPLTTEDDRAYMAGYVSTGDITDDDTDQGDDIIPVAVIEKRGPAVGLGYYDEWGDLQPAW